MTRLEALQAQIEYKNDNLLSKALIDRGVANPSAIYTASDQRSIDLASADIYLIMMNIPDIREGSKYTSYANGTLASLRRELLNKWGVDPNANAVPVSAISVPQDSRNRKSW